MPLIDVYPVVEPNLSPLSQQMAEFQNTNISPRRQANNALEMAKFVAQNDSDNGLPNALGKALKNCKAYKACKQLMPYLYDVPNISKYREKGPVLDLSQVCNEVKQYDYVLSAKQVLFHGGGWPTNNSNPVIGDEFELIEPFSTSLSPQVAAKHARDHKGCCLWIITIQDKVDMPAFVYNNANGIRFNQEKEILLAGRAIVKSKSVQKINEFTLIEVDMSCLGVSGGDC